MMCLIVLFCFCFSIVRASPTIRQPIGHLLDGALFLTGHRVSKSATFELLTAGNPTEPHTYTDELTTGASTYSDRIVVRIFYVHRV